MNSFTEAAARFGAAMAAVPTWQLLNQAFLATGIIAAYILAVGVYRLYFSPLAVFPGPKLAGKEALYHPGFC